MKKKILLLVIVLLCVAVVVFLAFGNKPGLNNIAENINNCETVKSYKEYGYEIKASTTNDTLTIISTMGETESKVDFKLDKNVLSNENLTTDELLPALLVINGVGQAYGYKDNELSKNINAFTNEFTNYTLDKEGLELIIGDNKISLKIDISKKIPLIDMDKFYLKPEEFDMIGEFVEDNENGNQSGKAGNVAYDVFVGNDQSTILIGQEEKLSDSAYKSILSALEVMYGKDVATHFAEIYPKFEDGKKTVEAFTIETNYAVQDQDESVFKDTKTVLVTIDNNTLK